MVIAQTPALIILPAIGFGIILGIVEMILIKGDEAFQGSHWFTHGLHIFPTLIIALLISMNVEYFLVQFGDSLPIWLQSGLMIRIAIALIIAIKVFTSSAVVAGARGKGMHESLFHCLLLGGLVAAAPYLWPLVEPVMPSWLGGSGSRGK